MVVLVERSRRSDCSTISAFSLRSRTVARRTVQTLIGSYVALRTSTLPVAHRPWPARASGPRRWCSSHGAGRSGAGGTCVAIGSLGKFTHGSRRPRRLARRHWPRGGAPGTEVVARGGAPARRRRQ